MTTNITIDAYAGWDIEVLIDTEDAVPKGLERSGPPTKTRTTVIVPAGIAQTILIWDTRQIVGIRELPR